MKNISISIIIPTYNRAEIIVRTLDSVRKQLFRNWECIVVDDGSTDDTEDVLSRFIHVDSRFIYLRNIRKKGAQGARNTGILNAKGDFVVLFDSDNIMHEDFLQKSYNAVIENSVDVCGVFSKVIDFETKQVVDKFDWGGDGYVHANMMTGKSYFDNSSTLIRRQKLLDIGLLDEECPSYQEWDTHIRLSKISTYITIKELLVDYYRGGADTISSSKLKDIKGMLFILHKFRREWMFRYPKAYLRKLCVVYGKIDSIKMHAEYNNLRRQYNRNICCFWQIMVRLYLIKNK